MIKNNSFGFRYISGGFYSLLIIFTILFSISFSGPAVGEIAGPGWFAGTADPVSHEDAQAYYDSKRKDFSIHALSRPMVMGVSAKGVSSSTSASLEITELARALQYDPKLIFDYVHNHIAYVPPMPPAAAHIVTRLPPTTWRAAQRMPFALTLAGPLMPCYASVKGNSISPWQGGCLRPRSRSLERPLTSWA